MENTGFSMFGISFKPLNEDNIEMIRIWRNSDDVRLFMQYQEIISREEQLSWFQKLDKNVNFYFVAYKDEMPFGLYNIKDVDFNLRIGEPGVFLKSRNFWEEGISIRGSLALIIFGFEKLKLDKLIIHVLQSNKKVLAYNKQLGFQIIENNNNSISYKLSLYKKDFYENKKIDRLVKYFEKN